MSPTTPWEVKSAGRINSIQLLVWIILGVIILRLIQLQVFMHGYYTKMTESAHFSERTVPAERGKILVWDEQLQSYYPLATNVTLFVLSVAPHQIKNADLTVSKLTPFLDPATDFAKLKQDFESGKMYLPPLKRKLSLETAKEIEKLSLPGVYIAPEKYRYYPEGQMAANILGFVNLDRVGQYGIEGAFNEKLKGNDGMLAAERDASGRPIALGRRESTNPEDGVDVVLTIDRAIQYVAEKQLKTVVDTQKAERGSVIVMDPKTGGILAMAQYPSFDPNNYGQTPVENFTNLNTQQLYEPGSVFKTITMCIGIDLGLVSPDTTYYDAGELKIADRTIKNSDGKSNGQQTMTEVLEKSLNTGAAFVAEKIGKRQYVDYLTKLGFTKKTGIEVGGEITSKIKDVRSMQDIDLATMSFGQGIAVTPIELLQAISAIANDGKIIKPHLISEILYPTGAVKIQPQEEQILQPQTANLVGAMMVSVVENGHGKKAGVVGYRIAGKTGTAQIPGPGGYLPENQTIGTFVGFGPVEDPAFVMITRVDKPSGVKFAESTAAPLFGDLATFLMHYLQIPPTR